MLDRRQLLAGCGASLIFGPSARAETAFPVTRSPEEWRRLLTPEQFRILREAGTELPGTSPLLDEHRNGAFTCAGCGHDLFSSGTKYDSRTGWPSFWAPLDKAVGTRHDTSAGMVRTEVHCSCCGGHLGHVFTDGPQPTGLRYCINGTALNFSPS